MRYMIYPVYYRKDCDYYQTDDPKGTDGKPDHWVLMDEQTCEAIYETSNDLALKALRAVAQYLNAEEDVPAIDTSKYDGYTKTEWSARNLGDGSPMSCDEDYDHDIPFMETQTDDFANPAIGYIVGGKDSHSLEERRANIKLMADAPILLEHIKKLQEE